MLYIICKSSLLLSDDVTLDKTGSISSEVISSMRSLLNSVPNWCVSYCPLTNTKKCFPMLISPFFRKKAMFNHLLIIGTSARPVVNTFKILNAQFSPDLTWLCHIMSVKGKISSMVGVLNRFGSTLN